MPVKAKVVDFMNDGRFIGKVICWSRTNFKRINLRYIRA